MTKAEFPNVIQDVGFEPLDPVRERTALSTWLARHEWPFHVNRRLTRERIAALLNEGQFDPPGSLLLWIRAGGERAGLLHVPDLDDLPASAPRFDLRLAPAWRGRGVGTAATRKITEELFSAYEQLKRIEAVTRIDNVAMRTVLERCGYVMEGYLRRTWPDDKGLEHDGALYSILRSDWREGVVTPVPNNFGLKTDQTERTVPMNPDDEPLGVRHNRQFEEDADSLGRRDNRPFADDDDMDSLGRRDNRPFVDDDDVDSLGRRDNRPSA